MAAVPKKVKSFLFPKIGTRVTAICALVFGVLGLASLVMGIISDVKVTTDYTWGMIWLDPYAWFFLAIALFIFGLWWLMAYFAAKG